MKTFSHQTPGTPDNDEITRLLNDLADEIEVGPAPLHAIKADSSPRRATWFWPGVAAASVALLAGTGVVLSTWNSTPVVTDATVTTEPPASTPPAENPAASPPSNSAPSDAPTPSSPTQPTTPERPTQNETSTPPPSGLVNVMGIDGVGIDVPAAWPVNATRCGQPTASTVIVDQPAVCMAAFPRPANVETIEFRSTSVQPQHLEGTPATVNRSDGLPVTAWETTCHSDSVTYCEASLWVGGNYGVLFSATATTANRAEELLSTVRPLGDLVAVPGPQTHFMKVQDEGSFNGDQAALAASATATYLEKLEALGFRVTTREVRRGGWISGMVKDVSPAATMALPRGAEVTVSIAR